MRLLNTKTFEFVSIYDPRSVPYAILSHVWSKQGEQTYQEILELVVEANRESNPRRTSDVLTRISLKVRRCCSRALADGYEFVWIDSSCIDKTSSAELSEAINSMYTWYSCAARCYALLEDVDEDDNPYAPASRFRSSAWFTRGWTLQELIAPALVVFLSQEWNPIGTKGSLAPLIEAITGVEADILTGARSPREVSVSKRMSWAAKRVTTREEDRAYSLLGLFEIYMPTIYGEGQNAFFRLQEEILKHIPDDTLFTWGRRFLVGNVFDLQCLKQQLPPWRGSYSTLFASSPSDFAHTSDFRPISHATLLQRLGLVDVDGNVPAQHIPPTYTTTRFGIRAELPLLSFEDGEAEMYIGASAKIGFLLCEDTHERLVAVILRAAVTYRDFMRLHKTTSTLLVGGRIPAKPGADKNRWSDHRLVTFTGDVLDRIRQSGRISVKPVHIAKGAAHGWEVPSIGAAENTNKACSLVFPPWRRSALMREGFAVRETVVESAASSFDRKHVFVLSHNIHGIVRLVIEVDTASSSLDLQMGRFSPGTPLTSDILKGVDVPYEHDVVRSEPFLRADDSTRTEDGLYPLTSSARRAETTGTTFLLLLATCSQSSHEAVFTLGIEIVEHPPFLPNE